METDTTNRVQFLDEADSISYNTQAMGKQQVILGSLVLVT